jgi:riboflavin kinase
MKINSLLPYYLTSKVIKGYNRGANELGTPTGGLNNWSIKVVMLCKKRGYTVSFWFAISIANFEEEVVKSIPSEFQDGVYYGYASLYHDVYPMVMSIGTNPYFNNPNRSAEVHLLHSFEKDFYGEMIKVVIVGYIRPQLNFNTKDELTAAIQSDIEEAKFKLRDETRYRNDSYLLSSHSS